MPKWTPARRSGYMPVGHGSDLAPLLVAVPKWTRLNDLAITPDTRPCQPLSEDMIAVGYLMRLREKARAS